MDCNDERLYLSVYSNDTSHGCAQQGRMKPDLDSDT